MEYSPLVNKMKLNLIDLIEEALQRRSLINSFSFKPAAIYIRLCCEYNSFYIYFLASALAPNSPYKPKGIERERMHGGRGWVNCIAAYIFLPQQPHPPPPIPHTVFRPSGSELKRWERCVCVCVSVCGEGRGKETMTLPSYSYTTLRPLNLGPYPKLQVSLRTFGFSHKVPRPNASLHLTSAL